MRNLRIVAWIVVITVSAGIANAGGDTSFTYQGRLLDAGVPANGMFNLEFGLWDAANGGNPIGVPQVLNNTPVTDGLFTVPIDFGANDFDNTGRWLEIAVNGVPLMPRQPITRAPYSIQTRGIFVDAAGNVGIDTTAPEEILHVSGTLLVSTGNIVLRTKGFDPFIELVSNNLEDQTTMRIKSLDNVGFTVTDSADNPRFVVTVAGNVGIGTQTPSNKLSVSGGGLTVFDDVGDGIFLTTDDWSLSEGTSEDPVYNYTSATDTHQFFTGGNTRMTIAGDGNVGIGTTAPEYTLHVVSASSRTIFGDNVATSGSTTGVRGESDSTSGLAVYGFASATSGTNYGVYGYTNSFSGYSFFAAGNGIDYGSDSSIRWKSNVRNIDQPLEKVARLRGVYFNWDDEHGGHHDVGMIAEEVGEVLPEIVNYEENGIDANGMDYSKLTPLLVEAINELHSKVEQKDLQITELQARLNTLETLVDRLVMKTQEGAK